jgi:carboxynorspermidine decarboxylase
MLNVIDNFTNLKTPCYVIDKSRLIKNLEVLQGIENRTDCKVLLAQKAFSMFSMYPLISKYISGTAASGLYEARLAHEAFGGEVHVYSPAYTSSDFSELIKLCSHIVFNSVEQIRDVPPHISTGLRVNPQFSTQSPNLSIYDPCSLGSRLGTTLESLKSLTSLPKSIEGLHFHTLCQQNADALEATLNIVIEKFLNSNMRPQALRWLNMGGGHHITREDYDIPRLERCIRRVQEMGLQVYLEPGEAVALNAGYLVSTVLDVVPTRSANPPVTAILDTSAACHMPDVLEMPYRPELLGGDSGSHRFRLAGNTCLAGDIIGDYSFDEPLKVGDRLVFTDMAIYTMVKNNTFNGMPLPSIAVTDCFADFIGGNTTSKTEIIREFSYEDFKNRLS